MTTSYPARRVGNRILCGRRAPGRGFCSGEIAHVNYNVGPGSAMGIGKPSRPTPVGEEAWEGAPPDVQAKVRPYIVLPEGMVEDPPGSGHWRLTSYAKRTGKGRLSRRIRGGRVPEEAGLRRPLRIQQRGVLRPPALPFDRPCPVCNVVATVDASLIE